MNPIVPPLKAGDRGDAVGNLQDALLLLLDRAAIPVSDEERRSLTALLRGERNPSPERRAMGMLRGREPAQPLYGEGTTRVVTLSQQMHRLPATGQVNDPTANALNAAVRSLTTNPAPTDASRPAPHDPAPAPNPLGQSEPAATRHEPANPHDTRASKEQNEPLFTVEGRVVSRERAGVGGLKVEIVDKNPGENGDVRLAETTTGEDGTYQVTFPGTDLLRRGKQRPDLQARVLAGQKPLGTSEVRYDASNRETLDVLLTSGASSSLPSEHTTLTGVLSARFKGNLRDLKESDDRQDITYLANKTGWDARAVALAALADHFSAKTKEGRGAAGIDPPFFYALLRAGVGGNEDALYQVDAATAARIWRQAIAQGVIPAELEKDIPQAAERFHALAAQRALDGPPIAGLSSLKQMLSVSLGDDPARQKKFADIYARHKGDPPKLWEAVRGAFGEAAEKRLRIDGQLGYLTLNNAPLIRKLHAAGGRDGLPDTVNLARAGLYRAEKWRGLIANDAIPAEINGENDGEKRARYAELLAAQVRLSFPTMVVAEMVRSGETPVGRDAKKEDVHAFLAEHHGKFEIGMQPVQQYIARNKLQVSTEVSKEITRIQRVYQITPSDGAMNALLKRGLDSALAVSRYNRDQFVRMYKDELGGEANARLTHAKAQQVHNAVFNIATSYLVAGTAPQIGVHSDPKFGATIPHAGDVIAYATLEKLFHEMDYCSCEHCRSVLSPAAYLVDLLHFLDREGTAWTDFLRQWESTHQNAPYPFDSLDVVQDQDREKTPLQVLLDRRPDIQHLPLTCENTNTPVPYVDLVNETLEYFVVSEPEQQPEKPAMSLADYQGHSTDGGVKAEELLASPQFVKDNAYTTIAAAQFPPPLPFHQPLESLRRYFDKFEAPLPEVMEALRKNDSLERPGPIEGKEYGWRDILMEDLSLSRAEYRLLTDHNVTIQDLYGFEPTAFVKDVLFGIRDQVDGQGKHYEERFGLTYAKAFSRRVRVSYEEIVELLKTRFVNQKLSQNGNPEPPVDGLIMLADPSDQKDLCNFDNVEFRYYRPGGGDSQLRAFEFVRMIRFIRLWKKLGWTIEQTDKAITALYPADPLPTKPNATEQEKLEKLDAGFSILLPRLGVIKRLMDALKLKPKKDLLPLLACFAPIDTHGPASLYRQMFLSPAPAESPSPFMADEDGNYLTNGVKLEVEAVRERLRAAFLLTDEELNEIAAALWYHKGTLLKLGEPSEKEEGAISEIFRRGWLARKLKLSVREFLALIRVTDIDPFAAPDPPDPAIMRFVGLVNRLRAASLKPEQALYLVWNQDLSGKSAPDQTEISAFARTLRAAFAAIESEFGLVDDPDGSIARARMALVYGNDATTFFFGLLDNTFVTEVPYDHPQSTLEQLILDAAPGRIAYDDFRKVLAYTGVLDEHARDTLIDFGTTSTFQAAVHIPQAEGGTLYAENQKVIAPFFDHYPELRPLYDAYAFFGELKNWVDYPHSEETLASSIMEAYANHIAYDPQLKLLSFKGVMSGDTHTELITGVSAEFLAAVEALFSANQQAIQSFFQGFFKPDPNEAASQEAQKQAYLAANDSVEKRRSLLLAAFLPELIRLRKRQQALQAISAATGSDIAFASALLDNNLVLNPAAAPEAAALDKLPPALDDLTAMEAGGATLPFTSAVWSGYLEVPENGFYNFHIETGGAVSPKLTLDGEDRLLQPPEPNAPGWSNKGAIELRAGTLYAFTLEVQSIAGDLKVRWETKGRGREVIPSRFLYPATLTDALRTTYIRFLKAVSLASVLKLTPAETVYFAAHGSYRIKNRGWLHRLPAKGSSDLTTSKALSKALDALIDFALLKAKLAPNDERLLTVLKDPAATIEKTDQTTESLLFALTRWDEPSLDELLVRFGKVLAGGPAKADREALKELGTFVRVNRAYGPVKKIGVSAAALINAATNAPDGLSVRAFKAALRARYDETDWLGVLRPINDALRALQRDALVAYILQGMSLDPKARHIDTPDKLFEYFLMDVQMDSCMQTSRIRHALSSVQLFIERCFMDLERRVAPEVFSEDHCKQWAWMKRYRVWEANRKVFLWPENWLWPELRDDQSPIFKEAMSELLQSDITEDRAATALLNYLSKLEEVAKLEPCGIHYVEGVPDVSNPVAHVVARTAGANRKYYYRRREGLAGVGEGYWTPWEQIKLDIEDNPVIPVVWKHRLFLFWLKILKQTPLSGQQLETGEAKILQNLPVTTIKTDPPEVTVQAMLCWSEYYNGKWQPTKTSDVNQPIVLEQSDPTGPNAFDRSTLVLWAMKAEEERALLVYSVNSTTWYTLYNSHSLPVRDGDGGSDMMASAVSIFYTQRFRQLEPGSDPFTIDYQTGFYPFVEEPGMVSLPVLKAKDGMRCRVVDPLHNLQNMWQAPFFYEDSRHVFYVTPEEALERFHLLDRYYGAGSTSAARRIAPVASAERRPPEPRRRPPGPRPYEFGLIGRGDPSLMERLVSEDAYINKGLPTTGTVRFGETSIGITGRVAEMAQKR